MIKQLFFISVSWMLGYTASAGHTQFLQSQIKGQGTPMILLHGMACSAEVWEDVSAYYQNHYEVHLIGIPGFGNSENLEVPHVLKAVRDALIAYVKTNNLERPVLMGHSMGGFISLWAAIAEPGLFGKIISVDGLPYFPVLAMPGITAESASPIAEQMRTQMLNQSPESARASQKMMLATMIRNQDKIEAVVDMGMQSNPYVIAQALGEMYTTDIRSKVHAIEIPVLALGAWSAYKDYGATLAYTQSMYEAQFDAISTAEVVMAPEAYHFIFYDEPKWFFEQVDTFLGKHKK